MRAGPFWAVLTVVFVLAGCNSPGSRRVDVSGESHARLYDGMGDHRREVTTLLDRGFSRSLEGPVRVASIRPNSCTNLRPLARLWSQVTTTGRVM